MIGLLYLLFFALYLWLSVKAVKWTARWAKAHGRRPRLWGFLAGLVMYSLVFWDLVPTYAMHRYYCATQAGFTVYQTLAEWKKANPGVAATLAPKKGVDSTRQGNRERYTLNQRFAWDIVRTRYPFQIVERDERIVDVHTGKVLARYVDFGTDILGVSRGTAARGISDYKEWLIIRSCESTSDRPLERKFYEFKYLFKHQREHK